MQPLSPFWKLYLSHALLMFLAILLALAEVTREGTRSYILVCSFLLLLVTASSLLTSRRMSRALQAMRTNAGRFATGDFTHRLTVPDSVELESLASALNHMADQLAGQIRVITQQRNEQEAILASMHEGVLALDTQARVITMNRAAEMLLGVHAAQAKGRTIHEIVRNVALLRLLSTPSPGVSTTSAEIILRGDEERFLQATATALRHASGQELGMLVVLNDVTQLHRLETIRRDFVANVSHELKTPITNIKGFIETLRDGALDDRPQAEHFLSIVARHADRLHAIVEDLLSLSRLEQTNQRYELPRTPTMLAEVFSVALLDCAAKAAARHITVVPSCDTTLRVLVNAPLLQQALSNLLDNAITYSHPHNTVRLEGVQCDTALVIHVHDQGPGIPLAHQTRIFERFYRVDKARSRGQGGTGLGLAIVKHIAQVHGGQVTVASIEGQGSTFTLRLPHAIVLSEPQVST